MRRVSVGRRVSIETDLAVMSVTVCLLLAINFILFNIFVHQVDVTRPDIAYAVGVLSHYVTNSLYNVCMLRVYLLQYLCESVHRASDSVGAHLTYMCLRTAADWTGDKRYAGMQELVWLRGGVEGGWVALLRTHSILSGQSECGGSRASRGFLQDSPVPPV